VDGEDETDDETDNAEARTPKTTRNPYAPTERERREHNVAHLPYRNWCRLFLEGRGLDLPHQHRPDEEVKQESVSIDYYFLGQPGAEGTIPAVAMRDTSSKALFSHIVPHKGVVTDWVAEELIKDLEKMGHKEVIIKSDQEPAIIALVDMIRQLRVGWTMSENSAVGDSKKNRRAERAVQAAEQQTRLLKLVLENRIGGSIPPGHPVMHGWSRMRQTWSPSSR